MAYTTPKKNNEFQRFILHLSPSLTLSNFRLGTWNVCDAILLYQRSFKQGNHVESKSTNNSHIRDTGLLYFLALFYSPLEFHRAYTAVIQSHLHSTLLCMQVI